MFFHLYIYVNYFWRLNIILATLQITNFAVCLQTYIPKTLDDVKHVEEDVQRIISGKDTGEMYYQTITGLKSALSLNNSSQLESGQQQCNGKHETKGLVDGESETETEESEGDSDSEDGSFSDGDKQTPAERKSARKENKKKVKEEKRESRKNKVPKAVKKKKKKLAKAKKTR